MKNFVLLTTLAAVPAALAQDVDQMADPLAGRDAAQGVFVDDSAAVREKFALASRMERLREWDNAADVYQELLRDYGGKVVPSQLNDAGEIVQYQSVATAVRARIGQWPADGLAVYRELFGGEAARRLATAPAGLGHDARQQLAALVEDYFATDAAAEAGVRLADLHLEAGDFRAAADLAGRLLTGHPDLGDRRAELLLRQGVARHLLGEGAGEPLEELRQDFPDARGVVAGEPTTLADALAAIAELPQPEPVAAADEGDWPMAFGAADRHRVPDADPVVGVERYFQLEPPYRSPGNRPTNRQTRGLIDRDRELGLAGGVLPAIVGPALYFQDNAAVYAVGLVGGMPLPGWRQTYGEVAAYVADAWSTPRGKTFAVAVTDRHVLAILGRDDPVAGASQGGRGNRDEHLAALDRATGELRWRVAPGDVALPGEAAAAADARLRAAGGGVRFAGSPIAAGGRVYVRLDNQTAQLTAGYVACLDEATGQAIWVTPVASSIDAGRALARGRPWVPDAAETHLAVESGRVFACTDTGAVAALDADDGSVAWLNLYARPEFDLDQARGRVRRRADDARRPAADSPVVVAGGTVFVLPPDGTDVLGYTPEGEQVFRLPRDLLGDAETIVGVAGEKLVVAGQEEIYCVDWQNVDPADPEQAVLWAATFAPNRDQEREGLPGIFARPFLTQRHVYVPTPSRIDRVSLANGLREDFYPREGGWPEGQGPGDVLIAGGQLVLSSAGRITVFADPQTIETQLREQIAAEPNQMAPRLRLAEALFVGGRVGEALAETQAAAERVAEPGEREEVFAAALSFGGQVAPHDADLARQYTDVAAGLAQTPRQAVRLAVALAAATDDPAGQVAQYQSVLDDADRRGVRLAGKNAGRLARQRIDELVAAYGPQVYAAPEAAAAQALADAADPAALEAVADRYPNSAAAADALGRAAASYVAAGDAAAAGRALRKQLPLVASDAAQASIYEELARLAAADPRQLDVAAARLRRAAALEPGAALSAPIALPGGVALADMTRAQAAEAMLRSATEVASAALPAVNLPPSIVDGKLAVPFGPAVDVPNVAGLLVPPQQHARNDRVLAVRGNLVRVLNLSGEELGQVELETQPIGAAWLGGALLLWTGPTVAAYDAQTYAPLWRIEPLGEAAEPAPGGVAGLEGLERQRRLQQLRLRQLNARANVQLAVGGGNGPVPAGGFVLPTASGDAGLLALAPGRIIVATPEGDVAAYDEATGQEQWRATSDAGGTPVALVASADHAAVAWSAEGGARLEAYDLADGRQRLDRDQLGRQRLVNLALDPGGMLVVLEPARLVGYDLAGDAQAAAFATTLPDRAGNNDGPFAASDRPGHLVTTAGRILALADANSEEQRVWAFTLADGQPVRFEPNGPPATFAPGDGAGRDVKIVPAGARFWVVGEVPLVAHDLDVPGRGWAAWRDPVATPVNHALLPARDVVLLIRQEDRGRPGVRRDEDLTLLPYSRMTDGGNDGGVLLHEVPLPGRAREGQWQALDGGFAYVTQDNVLHLLPGTGDK